mmetsp:Transcript_16675/g.56338  ORF Transcript_16675/g.56338 Transcript_16675/m.56338 type:complete len:358 (+) Transcript_16675:552-1625(+)
MEAARLPRSRRSWTTTPRSTGSRIRPLIDTSDPTFRTPATALERWWSTRRAPRAPTAAANGPKSRRRPPSRRLSKRPWARTSTTCTTRSCSRSSGRHGRSTIHAGWDRRRSSSATARASTAATSSSATRAANNCIARTGCRRHPTAKATAAKTRRSSARASYSCTPTRQRESKHYHTSQPSCPSAAPSLRLTAPARGSPTATTSASDGAKAATSTWSRATFDDSAPCRRSARGGVPWAQRRLSFTWLARATARTLSCHRPSPASNTARRRRKPRTRGWRRSSPTPQGRKAHQRDRARSKASTPWSSTRRTRTSTSSQSTWPRTASSEASRRRGSSRRRCCFSWSRPFRTLPASPSST